MHRSRVTGLLLARHGETDWNCDGRWQGFSDTPLNEAGREQARTLADRLDAEHIAAVYSSDLCRAYDTAAIIAERKALRVRRLRALREVNLGSWEGLTRAEIAAAYPEAYERWNSHAGPGWENGESEEQMSERVLTAAQRIVRAHEGESVLVVTHGGPIRALLAHAEGVAARAARRSVGSLENCDYIRLEASDGVLSVVR